MLFRLFFTDPEFNCMVLGAIDVKGKVYFSTSDVASVMGKPAHREWIKKNASCKLSEIVSPLPSDGLTRNCRMIERKVFFHYLMGVLAMERKTEKIRKLLDNLFFGRVRQHGEFAKVLHFRPASNGKLLVPYLMELQKKKASDTVDVGVYYESLCPDSQAFVQEQLLHTYLEMQEYMNVELIPYGNAHYDGVRDRYTFTCQHGPDECYGNMVQTCYITLVNNTESRLKFVNCAFNFPTQKKIIQKCIDDPDLRRQVKKCVTGTLGPNLQYEMAKKTDSLQPPHNFIPWITINGKGSRDITDKACNDLTAVICDALTGTKPETCDKKKLSLFKRFRNYYL